MVKTRILILMLFVASYGFSQSVNDYKAVIIPMKYDFQKTENQYRLQTKTKVNLQNAGMTGFYTIETIPTEFSDRCSVLYVDVVEDKAFLVTKLFILFKDCYGKVVYESLVGKSKEKKFEIAYAEALNEAFKSVNALNYKYNGGSTSTKVVSNVAPQTSPSTVLIAENKEVKKSDLLYAQPTSYGYQLIDNEPKVVMKVYKTSNPSSFMATKGSVQGVLVSKDNQWFFEYYQNDQLISEKVEVKF